MKIPIQFPSEAEEYRLRAESERHVCVADKMRVAAELGHAVRVLGRAGKKTDAQERLQDLAERSGKTYTAGRSRRRRGGAVAPEAQRLPRS